VLKGRERSEGWLLVSDTAGGAMGACNCGLSSAGQLGVWFWSVVIILNMLLSCRHVELWNLDCRILE